LQGCRLFQPAFFFFSAFFFSFFGLFFSFSLGFKSFFVPHHVVFALRWKAVLYRVDSLCYFFMSAVSFLSPLVGLCLL
jgi:hypothetical protein